MRGRESSRFKVQSSKLRNITAYAVLGFAIALSINIFCGAATNDAGDEFKLRPPRGEIAPSFWEQNGKWIVPVAFVALIVLGLLVWYLTRPRPVPDVPPEVRARKALEALAAKPPDREVLSRTSQVLKAYLAQVFGLPGQEMTTAEFCKALNAGTEPGDRLSNDVCEFLRRGDQMKFSPEQVPASTVPEALKLLDRAETRRAELRAAPTAVATRVPEVAKS